MICNQLIIGGWQAKCHDSAAFCVSGISMIYAAAMVMPSRDRDIDKNVISFGMSVFEIEIGTDGTKYAYTLTNLSSFLLFSPKDQLYANPCYIT